MIEANINDKRTYFIELTGNFTMIRMNINGEVECHAKKYDKPFIIYPDGSVKHPPGIRIVY